MDDLNRTGQVPFKKITGILLAIVISLLFVGCSPNGTADEDGLADKNKEAIQAVIETEFNGPDEKYRELWDAATETQTAEMNEEEYNAWLETPAYKNYTNYMEEAYRPYFTENGYETFINTSAFSYSFSDAAYKINTDEIEISQSKNEPTLYNFTFIVNYENEEGDASDYRFEGSSLVPEEGKIGKIQFEDKDGLMQTIRE